MSTNTLRERSAIPVEYTWDTESVYTDIAAWEAAMNEVRSRIAQASAYQGRLHEGPTVLADCLDYATKLYRDAVRIYMYAALEYNVDSDSQAAAARSGRGQSLLSETAAALAFIDAELMQIGFATLHAWVTREPRLADYAHYIRKLEDRADHVRSAEVEELLGQVNDPFGTASGIHGVLVNADLTFEPARTQEDELIEIGQSTYQTLIISPDREVRRTAWNHYADAHMAYKNTMAACLLTGVKQNVFTARARRYDSALDAALAPNQIPPEVFHNLIETYRKHLPTWHRYWRVRAKAMGLETLREYDLKAPLTEQPHIPYEQAVEWIAQGMAPLGETYVETLRRGCQEERWVDIYPNKGKRTGAFSWGGPGTHPFIMMSYTDDLYSLSTLAHELGHSLHSYLSWENQPLVNTDYSLFAAEVASNFNQAMVRDYLFKLNDDRDFQIAVIEEAMANFHRYFFIMPTLARFELAIHEQVERGDAFNADGLIEQMADLLAEGYGDGVTMDRARSGTMWMQFSSHLYSNFYVYQYATGIAGANALAQQVLTDDADAAERYLDFLRAGGSLYPLDALELAGIDLRTPAAVEAAFDVLAGLVDRLESLVA
ncbi:MAG: oligoendopeptidase F [Caldilineaceae bacterium]|nr:oligoendopeptidase F [Caldilineaceae bacterium]